MYQGFPVKKNPQFIKYFQTVCVVLLVVSHCLWAAPSQTRFKVRLFISASLGEPTIKSLIRDMASQQNSSLVVRGIEDQTISSSADRWYRRFSETGVRATVDINPVLFQENHIDRVPALSLEVDGKTAMTAFGVTSIDWLLRQYKAGQRGHIGTFGTTFPITEPDLLEMLLTRLKQQDWELLQSKARQRLQSKVFSSGILLPTSRRNDSKIIPIQGIWNTPIIVLDTNNQQHQKTVMPWLQQHPNALVMVTTWSAQQIQSLSSIWHEHLIYRLPKELILRFQITTLPALLTPEKQNHWQVTTAAVSDYSLLDWGLWARTMISAAMQPAHAQEADSFGQESPAKALCQNVPILSEKLITSVPWKELFPIRIGLAKLGSGKEPNHRAKTSTGLCLCEDSAGMVHPGVTTGFWRPQRLIELTRGPGCLMALGGHKLPITDQRRWGTLGSANIPKGLTYMHAHVYSLPLIEMLNMYTGIGGCTSDLVDFDLINISEVDPTWNHPELAALLSPDLAAYANPAALNACTDDGLAALNSQPMDNLHWCAGSWGNLYPLSGFTSTYGHFSDNTSLLATRALAKIHRIGLARKTVGEDAQCHSRITPWLPKSQYKMSMFWPEPEKQQAHWIGASAATWGMHRHLLGKDDAMYLIWQYRDCCQTAVSQ